MTELFTHIPAHQRHSETSYTAAREIAADLNDLQYKVFRYLLERGSRGATDKEGYTATGIDQNTYRPRRIELWDMGKVIYSGEKRDRSAVWKLELFATPEEKAADKEYRQQKGA